MGTTPSIRGYERDGDWLVPTKWRASHTRLLREPPPRRFGVFDQIAIDLRTLRGALMYGFIGSSIAYSIVTGRFLVAVFGVAWLVMLVRGMRDAIAMRRTGVVRSATITKVDRVSGVMGYTDGISVGATPTTIMYELAPVRTILQTGAAVEMLVLHAPTTWGASAYALAYRSVATPGEPRTPG